MINLVVGEDVVNETVWKNILARAKSLPNPVVEYNNKTINLFEKQKTLHRTFTLYTKCI